MNQLKHYHLFVRSNWTPEMAKFLGHWVQDLVRVDGQRIRIFHEPCPGPVWSQRKRYNVKFLHEIFKMALNPLIF